MTTEEVNEGNCTPDKVKVIKRRRDEVDVSLILRTKRPMNKSTCSAITQEIESTKEAKIIDADPDYAIENPSKPVRQKKIDVITEDVASALDRTKTTNRNALHLVPHVAKALKKNLASIKISKSTIARRREESRIKIFRRIKGNYISKPPLNIGFDSKRLPGTKGFFLLFYFDIRVFFSKLKKKLSELRFRLDVH